MAHSACEDGISQEASLSQIGPSSRPWDPQETRTFHNDTRRQENATHRHQPKTITQSSAW